MSLIELGVSILKKVCHPDVLTVFRLAFAASDRAPEIAEHSIATAVRLTKKPLAELVGKAQGRKLVRPGDPEALATRYLAVLWEIL
jgi:hypothetical protein